MQKFKVKLYWIAMLSKEVEVEAPNEGRALEIVAEGVRKGTISLDAYEKVEYDPEEVLVNDDWGLVLGCYRYNPGY